MTQAGDDPISTSARRRALVTGGASGLGRACAQRLRAEHHEVITADIADGADIRLDISIDKTVSRAIAELELRHLLGPAHVFHRYQAGDVGEDVGGGFPVHVAWLASDRCSFSTGAVYDISGGRATY